MRIRIKEASDYADPYGSGSETLVYISFLGLSFQCGGGLWIVILLPAPSVQGQFSPHNKLNDGKCPLVQHVAAASRIRADERADDGGQPAAPVHQPNAAEHPPGEKQCGGSASLWSGTILDPKSMTSWFRIRNTDLDPSRYLKQNRKNFNKNSKISLINWKIPYFSVGSFWHHLDIFFPLLSNPPFNFKSAM